MESFVEVTERKIIVENCIAKLCNPRSGATSVFIGTTRNELKSNAVVNLEYEVYERMAKKEMQKICSNMRRRWPVLGTVIVHRVGSVPVGEISVLIAACSSHRKDAQESVMFGIDAVKTTAPIWKKECYADGTSCWKANME